MLRAFILLFLSSCITFDPVGDAKGSGGIFGEAMCDPGCAVGEICSRGQCSCDPTTCPGCCQGGRCIESSNATCGKNGASCSRCAGLTPYCSNGECVSTCSETVGCDSGCCADSTCQPGTESAACGLTGGACIDCTTAIAGSRCNNGACGCASESDCPVGQACSGGVCSTACSAQTTCNGGCCAGGQCTDGLVANACGASGLACNDCNTSNTGPMCLGSGQCGCQSSLECAGRADGSTCLTSGDGTGVCGCTTNADCPDGAACNGSGQCSSSCDAAHPCKNGCCNAGTCVAPNACPGALVCGESGMCPARCDAASGGKGCIPAFDGCCNEASGECVNGDQTSACGAAGSCFACNVGQSCVSKQCDCGTCGGGTPVCRAGACNTCDACWGDNLSCTGEQCVLCDDMPAGHECDHFKDVGGKKFCNADGHCSAGCDQDLACARVNPNLGRCKNPGPSGACVQCLSGADCPSNVPICDATTNTCVQCISENDCPFNNACNNKTCTSNCSGGQKCRGGCCNLGLCQVGYIHDASICGRDGNACRNCPTLSQNKDCLASLNPPGGYCGCTSNADCTSPSYCNTSTGTCSTNCSGGQRCNGGCCNNGSCVSGTSRSACGGSGYMCLECLTGENCVGTPRHCDCPGSGGCNP